MIRAHITIHIKLSLEVLFLNYRRQTHKQPAPVAGAAAAEGAKHRDENSLVLLFEAVLVLKIVQGGSTGCP